MGEGGKGSSLITGGWLSRPRCLVEPSIELVDAIYREKVFRSRKMTIERRLEVTAELCDLGREMMRESIRREIPSASEVQVHELMRQRLELARRLDDIPFATGLELHRRLVYPAPNERNI